MAACHVYDSKYYKALAIACCDMQFENVVANKLVWENLKVVMVESGVPIVNFKGFMANNAHANKNTMRKTYGDGDQVSPWLVMSAHVFSLVC